MFQPSGKFSSDVSWLTFRSIFCNKPEIGGVVPAPFPDKPAVQYRKSQFCSNLFRTIDHVGLLVKEIYCKTALAAFRILIAYEEYYLSVIPVGDDMAENAVRIYNEAGIMPFPDVVYNHVGNFPCRFLVYVYEILVVDVKSIVFAQIGKPGE